MSVRDEGLGEQVGMGGWVFGCGVSVRDEGLGGASGQHGWVSVRLWGSG